MDWGKRIVGCGELMLLVGVLLTVASIARAEDTIVSFKSWQNKYLAAEAGGGDAVSANRTSIGSWERFVLEGRSPVMHGDRIHIRTVGGYYLSSETSGNLIANRQNARTWETFTLINHSNPNEALRNGDVVSLESYHGKYVVAEQDGTANANRAATGSWEKFTVIAQRLPEVLPQDDWEQLDNVALCKSTGQSSTGAGGEASRAADGNTNGRYSEGSVSKTNLTAAPWWSVDLGAPHRVEGVSIWNRTDCCSERLADFHVDYLDEDGNLIASANHPGGSGTKSNIALAADGVVAVRVQLRGTNYLSLAEVQVFGMLPVDRNVIEAQIADLYRDILGREPDPSGLAHYSSRVVARSMDLERVARSLFHSAEFVRKSHQKQVVALYRLILDRNPDAGALAGWTDRLYTGKLSLYAIAEAFIHVREFAGKPAQHIQYIRETLDVPAILDTKTHNNPAEQRKAYFRETIVGNDPNGLYPMPILAYEGLPIRTQDIHEATQKMLSEETGDFRLAQLVRILYLTQDYDDLILPHLQGLDYWLTPGEDQYCYWSENHMILWMSSAYLVRQLEGWPMDPDLDKRLRHYLDIKLEYGFYEFFSPTYLPFTLAALLNLADFAVDSDIKDKATAAAQILMKNWLLVTNDQGAFHPAAGRAYSEQYKSFNSRSIAWITTRLGPLTNTDYVGAFLSTSGIDLRDVAASWRSSVNTTFEFGHSQSEHKTIHADMSRVDRTIFQWSSGGYFHPDVADDTTYLVDLYDLEANHHFSMFKSIPDLPDSWSNGISKIGATFSRSSSISSARIKVYKNRGAVLTSIDDYFPGYRGYQQWPWVATIGDIAVWTQSGEIGPGWEPASRTSANSHLPKVQQTDNVAMITYFPNLEIRAAQWLGEYDTQVSLYWPTERFDETTELGRWIIGRKAGSYVAVLRYETGMRNGFYYSNANRGRQMWAVVVGNDASHGSFSQFVNVIERANIKETYKFDFSRGRVVYFTRIDVDGKYIRNWW